MTETTFSTENGVRVSICEWEGDGAWLHLQLQNGSAYASLNRSEAEQLLAGLQAILHRVNHLEDVLAAVLDDDNEATRTDARRALDQ
jgi:hypothetical protein